MKNKNERLLAIRKLIGTRKISAQEELLHLLRAGGFNMTQATLSRDLKYLKVAKKPDDEKGYVYFLPESELNVNTSRTLNFPANGYLSINFAQGMGIIKTLPGFASSIASAIDSMNYWEIMGTIAGDDTILVIPRDGVRKGQIISALEDFIPGVKAKLTQV